MAELGSWPSIRDRGLLSTTALLDLYEVTGEKRLKIEERHRPNKVPLNHPNLPRAFVRDQIPMRDADLKRCLPTDLSPRDWYRLLNQKAFFWLSRKRLCRMLNAGAYQKDTHDVLELDARALVEAYRESIWLCPINSGATKPFAHPRGRDTFLRIPDYPYAKWRKSRTKGERVVEVAVDYGVPNVRKFVTRVVEMRCDKELNTLYRR